MVLDDFLFMLDAREHCSYSHGRSDYGTISRDLIAPEILQSYRAVSPKADVWAFGCCLYQWLTGALPSVHSNPSPPYLRKYRRFIGPMYSAISLAATLSVCRADANDLVRILSANLWLQKFSGSERRLIGRPVFAHAMLLWGITALSAMMSGRHGLVRSLHSLGSTAA